jgi:DNA ligase D-like protein (predicted 3'-phosphoesterase)
MRFVVHEHWSRNHHFDLRLEMDGVLKSWAVPKGIPLEKGIRRLAIRVDDHDLSYIDFEGEIEGGYGKGVVRIFDNGDFELSERREDKFILTFKGGVRSGKYALVHWKEKNWLIFKSN